MPIGHSRLKLTLLSFATTVIDAIPIFATMFSVLQFMKMLSSPNTAIGIPSNLEYNLSIYLHIETAFLVYFYLQYQRLQKHIPPPPLSELERGKTFFRILDHSSNEFRDYFAGWFYWKANKKQVLAAEFHLIRRDNFRDWFSWMLYGARSYDQLLQDPNKQPLVAELNAFIQDFELAKNIVIQPGRNGDMEPLILNYNTVEAYPKPLIFYSIIALVESIAFVFLHCMGFQRFNHKTRELYEATTGINYWKRSSETESKHLPIVFFHGIGCGLFPYVELLMKVVKSNATNTIFLVELPHVAMRLTGNVPSMQQTIFEIETMLDSHGFPSCIVVGHSLGTAV
ncbi:hypothetical protein HDU99_009404 [Rhizoclosmatium hyalinum]|nr:hypothetical protein HDU99_009404 [Rhizoclosmatium hyalinum]